jgi:hypothetical protein
MPSPCLVTQVVVHRFRVTIIRIQRWLRGCMRRLQHRLLLMMRCEPQTRHARALSMRARARGCRDVVGATVHGGAGQCRCCCRKWDYLHSADQEVRGLSANEHSNDRPHHGCRPVQAQPARRTCPHALTHARTLRSLRRCRENARRAYARRRGVDRARVPRRPALPDLRGRRICRRSPKRASPQRQMARRRAARTAPRARRASP